MRLRVFRTSSALFQRRLVASTTTKLAAASSLPSTSGHFGQLFVRPTAERRFSSNSNGGQLLPEDDQPKDDTPLRITPRAAEQLRRITATGEHMRVSVDSGGCSGFEYKLALDSAINADDEVIEADGARVIVDQLSLGFIRGSKLDFVEDMMRSAFRITDNPAATQGCSCGASFAPKSMI